MTVATWDVVDRGSVPEGAKTIMYDCPGCGRSAGLPVLGVPVAQAGPGIVFEHAEHAMPKKIRCRHCRRTFVEVA